jgi:hypothetical protein
MSFVFEMWFVQFWTWNLLLPTLLLTYFIFILKIIRDWHLTILKHEREIKEGKE